MGSKAVHSKQHVKKLARNRTAADDAVATATLKHARLSAQKARLVLNMIRGMQVDPALQALAFSPKKGARLIEKLLKSAIMNAKEVKSADIDSLWVTAGWVNMAKPLKRFMPRARGSANEIKKHSSHITIVLGAK